MENFPSFFFHPRILSQPRNAINPTIWEGRLSFIRACYLLIRIAELADLADLVEIYNQAISEGQRTADMHTFSVDDRLGLRIK